MGRWLARLLPGLRHCSDYGTQEGVDSFRRLEYRCHVRFENNGYNTFRHLFSKAIRLGSAVIEPVLLAHRVAYGPMFLTGGHALSLRPYRTRLRYWPSQAHVPEGYASQSVKIRPATLPNSPVLCVTKVRPCATATAAIIMSFGPISVPACSSSARMRPYVCAQESSKGKDLKGDTKLVIWASVRSGSRVRAAP